MSEKEFNKNLKRIRHLHSLKGKNLFVLINKPETENIQETVFVDQHGKNTKHLSDALVVGQSYDMTNKPLHFSLCQISDYDIELHVKQIMDENVKNMDHLSYHPDDWKHLDD